MIDGSICKLQVNILRGETLNSCKSYFKLKKKQKTVRPVSEFVEGTTIN